MEQLVKRESSKAIAAIFCLALLLYSAPAYGKKSNKRCYTVQESISRSIKHCYSDKEHPHRYSTLDIPVSLAVGTVRTPEFSPPKSSWYLIMVEMEKPFPTDQIMCMTGTNFEWEVGDCKKEDPEYPLLRADWTAWEDGKVILTGSSTHDSDEKASTDYIAKFLGGFPMRVGHKYVLEVKFTKDGTPLNVANPHLIITKVGNE